MKWTKDFISNYKITCLHRIVKLVITESAKCTDTCMNVKYKYCSIYFICKNLDKTSTKIIILSKLCMYLLKTNLIYKYLYNKIYFQINLYLTTDIRIIHFITILKIQSIINLSFITYRNE